MSCCGEILSPKDFIVLIYDSGNVQIFMCIHATHNGSFGNFINHDGAPVRKQS
ncbi:hypothetical protein ECW26_46750 [Escherichia coli W26]|nr:hypothetical protein ECW26_46750 [Escherichia coli W26]